MNKQMTRMEKWKVYRIEIQKNISLQESIANSNKKLNILSNRLIKAFPEYAAKYPFKKEEELIDINLNDTSEPELFSIEDSNKIIELINTSESNEEQSLQYIEKFNFSSGELDSIIDEVKVGKVSKVKYINIDETSEKNMQFQKVQLPKKE
ncbi:hypothetical protein MYMA111404_00970 [Mycoplasma marinum]|nr:hypothetical protein [Mycoplasma marinum]